MIREQICESCHQKHNCGEVYRRLGNSEKPSVVVAVLVAFLLPMVVFIASLAVFQAIFTTALSFFCALLTTFLCVSCIRIIKKRLRRK